MINPSRQVNHFVELVTIDSESRFERDVALKLQRELEELGAETWIDDAGEKVGGNVGNLFARIPATDPSIAPFFLSAHMDTVPPGRGVKPVVSADRITSDGTTVLGGDDKSGLAIIMEALRSIVEDGERHGDLEVCFTICEERGLLGAKHFDVGQVRAKHGLVLDTDSPSFLFTRGPAAVRMEWFVNGLEAHAGTEPEKGISAIQVAASAIQAMKLGRIDLETTANIGVVEGGVAANVIPRRVRLVGEARSLDPEKLRAQSEAMSKALHDAAERAPRVTIEGVERRATVEEHIHPDYERLDVDEDSPIVRLVFSAAERMGLQMETGTMGGGCDANVFNRRGLLCANLGTGMHAIHTVKEWLDLAEFDRATRVLQAVLREHAF